MSRSDEPVSGQITGKHPNMILVHVKGVLRSNRLQVYQAPREQIPQEVVLCQDYGRNKTIQDIARQGRGV